MGILISLRKTPKINMEQESRDMNESVSSHRSGTNDTALCEHQGSDVTNTSGNLEAAQQHHGSERSQLQRQQHHGNDLERIPQDAAAGNDQGLELNQIMEQQFSDRISNIWSEIDKGLDKWLTINNTRPTPFKLGWKVVRLFVSSTFTDFYTEREVLVKRVIPQLNEWCQARKVQIVECDLRWGIPKDSTTNDTVDICLSEIEKCLEETAGEAFFLNFLGERYGWVPDLTQIGRETVDRFDLINDVSITHTEILHASLRSNTKNALFLLRNGCLVDQIPENLRSLFKEDAEFGRRSLQELKNQLRERFPKQVMDYSCCFGEVETTAENTKVILNGLEDFENKVIDFFKAAIERMYPQVDYDLTSDEWNFIFQDTFIEKKGALLVGREKEKKQILDFVSSEFNDAAENYMLITGPSGIGKSSLLANVVRHLKTKNSNCIYNFASASPGSTVSTTVRENFTKKLMQFLEVNGDDFDDLQYEEKVAKYNEIINLFNKEQKQVLLVFDAVNQFSNSEASFLNWLPSELQGNMKCIIGCTDDNPLLASLKDRLDPLGYKELHITGFGPFETKDYIQSIFSKYNKRLDKEQLEDMTSRNESHNPLWLSLACEELRVFGEFERLTGKIRSIPDNLQDLVFVVLQRLITEDETGVLKDTVCYLACCTSGLTETELRWSNGNEEEPLPLLPWKRCRLLLQPYLLMVGKRRGEENLAFFHDSFNVVVKERLLSAAEEKMSYHSKLANVFKMHCNDDIRVAEELPTQLEQAGEFGNLLEYYRRDKRSLRNMGIMKGLKLKKIRCQMMINVVNDKFSSPVYICNMCSNRTKAFTPVAGLNKDYCFVCGSHVPFKKETDAAYLCMKHKDFTAPGTAKCCVCKTLIFLQQNARTGFNKMYLCTMCNSQGKRCCKLQC